MATPVRFSDFHREHHDLTKAEFLARFQSPYLYLCGLTDSDMESLFQTQVRENGPATPRRPHKFPSSDVEPEGVLALEKDLSNDFNMMITLGRTANNDLTVPEECVSKFHAYFRKAGDDWTIIDANSTNGTQLDGIPLVPGQAYSLRSGATIQLAEVLRMVFVVPEELYELLLYTPVAASEDDD